jgi:hypothetical protein
MLWGLQMKNDEGIIGRSRQPWKGWKMPTETTSFVRLKLDELDQARKDARAAARRVEDLQALVKQLLASNEIAADADKKRASRLTRPPRAGSAGHGPTRRKTRATR